MWIDRVCGAVVPFVTPATTEPDFTSTTDLSAVQQTFSRYLGSVVSGVQVGRTQRGAVGASPVDGGDETVGKVRSALTLLEQDFTGARATVDAADPNDPQAFIAPLNQVQATLKAVKAPDALGDIAALPRLQKAAERAPQCRTLSTMANAVPK